MGRRALARIAAVAAGVAVVAGLAWGVTSVTLRMQEASGTPTGIAPVVVPGTTTAPVEPAPSEAPVDPAPVEPVQPQPVEPAPPAPAPPVDDDDDDDDDVGEVDDD